MSAATSKRTQTQKQKTYDKGVWAEKYAGVYLKAKGYKILQTRYKTKFGEIDLIIQKDKSIAFVEVKARRSIEEALHSITPKMKERIANAAQFYLSENPEILEYDLRFDVIAIKPPLFLDHLENAWQLES
ncbi:MAG: YraN family protein [Pseudomonadota bacterium]